MLNEVLKQNWLKVAILATFFTAQAAGAAATDENPDAPPLQEIAAADASPDAAAGEGIATVTVYADKREVDLQKAPLSVTAVSDKTLEQANITDPTGLNGYVPGLQIAPSGGSERMVSIRGIGSQTPENFFTQPGVSFHMDGAYISNSIALNMGFLDVDRVEVLRGPQGTVFGQSSTGGTINVVGKQPVLGRFFG
ncbi:MAG: TonB-dependent receptor plug domain-containing protein, partial [Solimonas sp.]